MVDIIKRNAMVHRSNAYAGIGNRTGVPEEVLDLMQKTAAYYSNSKTLRSGGAKGSDKAFENGCDLSMGKKEIYTAKSEIPEWCYELVWEFHPAPTKLTSHALDLMARNCLIILGGPEYDPNNFSDFMICYAVNERKGGTAFGIRLCQAHNISWCNLARDSEYALAVEFIEGRNQ